MGTVVIFQHCSPIRLISPSFNRAFLRYIKAEVGKECGWGETSEQQHRVKFALRALGNAGVVPQDNFPEKCYKVSGTCIMSSFHLSVDTLSLSLCI